jgi:hypothetical protein
LEQSKEGTHASPLLLLFFHRSVTKTSSTSTVQCHLCVYFMFMHLTPSKGIIRCGWVVGRQTGSLSPCLCKCQRLGPLFSPPFLFQLLSLPLRTSNAGKQGTQGMIYMDCASTFACSSSLSRQ